MRPWGLRFNSSSRIVMAPLSNFDRGVVVRHRSCGSRSCGSAGHTFTLRVGLPLGTRMWSMMRTLSDPFEYQSSYSHICCVGLFLISQTTFCERVMRRVLGYFEFCT